MQRVTRRFSVWRLPRAPHAGFNSTAAQRSENTSSMPRLGDWGSLTIPGREEIAMQKRAVNANLFPSERNKLPPSSTNFSNRLARIRPKTIGGDRQNILNAPPNAFALRRKHAEQGISSSLQSDPAVIQRREERLSRHAESNILASPHRGPPRYAPRGASGRDLKSTPGSSSRRGPRRSKRTSEQRQVFDEGRESNKEQYEEFDDIVRENEPELVEEMRFTPQFEKTLSMEITRVINGLDVPEPTSFPHVSSDLSDVFSIPRIRRMGKIRDYSRYGVQDSSLYSQTPPKLGAVQLANLTFAHARDVSIGKRIHANTLIANAVNMVIPPPKRSPEKRMKIADRRKGLKEKKQ